MTRTSLALACLLLSGCATAPVPQLIPPATTVVCLPVKTYSPDEQRAISTALASLPANSPLIGVIADYEGMRDAARACKG